MSKLNEAKITDFVLDLKTRCKDAFSMLYQNYSASLFGVICKLINDRAVAEEILQDVFVKVWANIDKYDASKGTLFTWLLNITRNTCIDYLRSKRHKMSISERGLEYINDDAKDVQLLYGEDRRHLKGITQELEMKYKEVIVLIYFWGYTQKEAAKILDIPLGTVKTRCRNAIKQLRKVYND